MWCKFFTILEITYVFLVIVMFKTTKYNNYYNSSQLQLFLEFVFKLDNLETVESHPGIFASNLTGNVQVLDDFPLFQLYYYRRLSWQRIQYIWNSKYYSLIQYKSHNSKFKFFDGLQFRKYFISLPAFYLNIWLMKSPKNFEKTSILKIWQLVFFRGVKT